MSNPIFDASASEANKAGTEGGTPGFALDSEEVGLSIEGSDEPGEEEKLPD